MNRRFLLGCLILGLAASGCGPDPASDGGAGQPEGVGVWFDAPEPRTVYVPPAPCQIVAHAASSMGISQFELTVNDAPAGSIPSPDTQASLVTLSRECGLTEPGTYRLRIRAQDNGGAWSAYAETSLIIPSPDTPPPALAPISSSESADWIYYRSAAAIAQGIPNACSPAEIMITGNTTGVFSAVTLHFRLVEEAFGQSTPWQTMPMTQVAQGQWTATLNPEQISGVHQYPGWVLYYYFEATDAEGALSQTDWDRNVNVTQCPETGATFAPPKISTEKIFFRGGGCGPREVDLSIQALDPNVRNVVLFFRLRAQDGGETSSWNAGVAMSALGNGQYGFTLASESIPGFASFPMGKVQYQFVAEGSGGQILGRSEVFEDILLELCSR